MVFPWSRHSCEGQRKDGTIPCCVTISLHKLADCAYTYILSQQVCKHKLQHRCELYSTATIRLSMSGRDFTEESVGRVNLEKLKG